MEDVSQSNFIEAVDRAISSATIALDICDEYGFALAAVAMASAIERLQSIRDNGS